MKKLFTLMVLYALTISLSAQAQKFYEWKDGSYTERSLSEVDSITFTLPVVNLPKYAVDLGLPSGTIWADRNIGADSPEGYGDYYAWGEIVAKSYYSWSTYKWCNGNGSSMTKYSTNTSYGHNGFTDGKTILEASDDVAYADWEKKWRMPSRTEFSELLNECTWVQVTNNGVNGYRVTGPNGKSIFIPMAGSRSGSSIKNLGTNGYYWTSSLNENYPYEARGSYIGTSGCGLDKCNRYEGRTVRAVLR